MKKHKLLNAVIMIVVIFVVLISSLIFKLNSVSINTELDRVAIITDYIIQGNQSKYYELVTSIFDDAKKCTDDKCRKKISLKIHDNLIEMKGTPLYEGIYFIRLNNNGEIEKMFLHGQVKIEKVDTKGEQKVVKFITKNDYSIFTNNLYLKGFRIDSGISNMHYLNDFYSEAEIIVPIRTFDNQKIVGAIVKGYGD